MRSALEISDHSRAPPDTDGFNFFAEAGESVTALIRPLDAGATLTGEFVGLGGATTASGAGESVVVPLQKADSSGMITLSVSSDLATGYAFDIYRNTNIEDLTNDAGAPVAIDDSFVELGSGRHAAIGQSNGIVAGVQFLASNDPTQFVDISSTGTSLGLGDDGEATITTTVGNSAFPAGSVTVGNNGGIIAAASEDLAVTNGSLPSTAWETALLPFWDDIDSDTGDVYWEETEVGGVDTLIVQWDNRPHFSNVGSSTFQVQVFASGPVLARFAYQDVDFGNAGFDGGASATIGYQASSAEAYEYSFNSAVLSDGDVVDLINGMATTDVEEFTFEADAGTFIDVAIEGISSSFIGELVELVGPMGNVVATGTTSYNGATVQTADQVIGDYVASDTGTHTVRISTTQTATYSLLVTEDLAFDFEPNGSIASARSLDNAHGAFGFLSSGSAAHLQYNDASLFVDISGTGTGLGLGDDGEATITSTIDNAIIPAGPVTVANNGGVLAGGGLSLDFTNGSLPDSDFGAALLPFWDDIDSETGDVYWEETVIDGNAALVIQWNDRPHYPNTDSTTFQVQLFESGPVAARYAYRDVEFGDPGLDNGASATIGVQLTADNAHTVSQNVANVFADDVIDILLQEDDIYALTLADGESVELATATPFDHPDSRPANLLDPNLTVLDGAGNVLASDSDSAADGKNARLSFTAEGAGTYYVAVSGDAGAGDYVLTVESGTPCGSSLDGDYDCNGVVDSGDLDMVLFNWGLDTDKFGIPAGWEHDFPEGVINSRELDRVLFNWGNTSLVNNDDSTSNDKQDLESDNLGIELTGQPQRATDLRLLSRPVSAIDASRLSEANVHEEDESQTSEFDRFFETLGKI